MRNHGIDAVSTSGIYWQERGAFYATIAHAKDGTLAARTVLRLYRRKVVNVQTVYDCNRKP